VSLELLIVLASSKAPDWSSWNQALWDARAPASLAQSVDLRRHNGFLPVRVEGRATGFHFVAEPAVDLFPLYPAIASMPLENPVVYSLSFGGRPDECAAAFLSASVLVSRFDGIAFDPQQGAVLSLEQVNDGAKQCLTLVHK
jgi:hypothetical protein